MNRPGDARTEDARAGFDNGTGPAKGTGPNATGRAGERAQAGTRAGKNTARQLTDPFGRDVTYLRVSVTDRCDFRCVYCMAENMTFLPRRDLLSLEELDRLASAFIGLGVRRIRLTGGEPLVRKNIMQLVRALSRHLASGQLDELTLTTNGSQLHKYADELFACGVRRVNVSLDTTDPERFVSITRWGNLDRVMDGLRAARQAGLHIKINMVALKGVNEQEIPHMLRWCHERGHDLTLIETMPLGEIDGARLDQYVPLTRVRAGLGREFTLRESSHATGGPARYVNVAETGGRLGFITPMTHNFCESCNRVRVTCTGRLYMCLGQEDCADLRSPLRRDPDNQSGLLKAAIREAIARKPKGHDFVITRAGPAVARHMSMTGG